MIKKIIFITFFCLLIFSNFSSFAQSRVVLVYSNSVWNGNKVDYVILNKMVDEGIKKLTGKTTTDESWSSLFSGCEKNALKVNTITETYELSTRPELAMAVANNLVRIGKKPQNILIYDRGIKCNDNTDNCVKRESMKKVGFNINKSSNGVKIFELSSKGVLREMGKIKNRFFTEVEEADCIANLPNLKDHHIMGITFALKNHIGSVTNPELFHQNAGVPQVADLNNTPIVKEKTKLIIGDLLRCQYNKGPHSYPEFHWNENAIMLSQDPVAADAIAFDILKKKRKEMGLSYGEMAYGGKPGEYIKDAGLRCKLGEWDPAKIEVITVNVN